MEYDAMILALRKTPQAATALAFDGAVGGGLWIFAAIVRLGSKQSFVVAVSSTRVAILSRCRLRRNMLKD
jgi:hypothetical protein